MNNTIIFILAIIDWFSEAIQLTFEAGEVAAKVIIPALVFIYVVGEMSWDKVTSVGEMSWDKLTSYDMTLKVYNTPLTTGYAY